MVAWGEGLGIGGCDGQVFFMIGFFSGWIVSGWVGIPRGEMPHGGMVGVEL